MHRGDTDHFHPYDVSSGGGHGHGPNQGHNHRDTAQWQVPHKSDHDQAGDEHRHEHEPDFDLVEQAFVAGFQSAPDPTSFLRLAGIPFEAKLADGTELKLLRVSQERRVDIGALAPHLGGETFRYDPLPAQMVSKRDHLVFIYFDGAKTRPYAFEDARALGGR